LPQELYKTHKFAHNESKAENPKEKTVAQETCKHTDTQYAPSAYLDTARATAQAIRAGAVVTPTGTYWVNPEGPNPQIDFYHGSAGFILFFIQLERITGDQSYLADARAGGDYILAELTRTNYAYPITSAHSAVLPYQHNETTFLSGGFAGVAFALVELAKATGNSSYADAAYRLTQDIVAAALPAPDGVMWTGYSGAYHDCGTVLYLLWASAYFQEPSWRDVAIAGGRAVITTGIELTQDGVAYIGFKPMAQGLFNDPHNTNFFPNYSYGSSGMAFTFARLYEETGDKHFLEAAKKGANYLISVADSVGASYYMPYTQPEKAIETHYLGLCHGNTGAARLFLLLSRLTGEQVYEDFLFGLVQGIIDAGAPEAHNDGYWYCHCQCCGTAGFVNLFLGMYFEYGDPAYLSYATRCGTVLLEDAVYEKDGAFWPQAFSRVAPDTITVDLGYFGGATGMAVALLQVYTALVGDFQTIRLPDDPFLSAPVTFS
jgi:lantibiotic modifying enzyme